MFDRFLGLTNRERALLRAITPGMGAYSDTLSYCQYPYYTIRPGSRLSLSASPHQLRIRGNKNGLQTFGFHVRRNLTRIRILEKLNRSTEGWSRFSIEWQLAGMELMVRNYLLELEFPDEPPIRRILDGKPGQDDRDLYLKLAEEASAPYTTEKDEDGNFELIAGWKVFDDLVDAVCELADSPLGTERNIEGNFPIQICHCEDENIEPAEIIVRETQPLRVDRIPETRQPSHFHKDACSIQINFFDAESYGEFDSEPDYGIWFVGNKELYTQLISAMLWGPSEGLRRIGYRTEGEETEIVFDPDETWIRSSPGTRGVIELTEPFDGPPAPFREFRFSKDEPPYIARGQALTGSTYEYLLEDDARLITLQVNAKAWDSLLTFFAYFLFWAKVDEKDPTDHFHLNIHEHHQGVAYRDLEPGSISKDIAFYMF